jgi:TRAP-type mannitol/chloroaromatic compound transport system permease large subunit
MLFGLDGVELALVITFLLLFAGIMSGFPVAFAIGGAALVSFIILAGLDSAGLLLKQVIDTSSADYSALVNSGIARDAISPFTYPDLPTVALPLFEGGWEQALNRNLSLIVSRIDERVLAGQSIETLLAVLMFVMMGITLERSRIANDLLTTMARVFGPLPGGLAVSVVVVGAFLAASTGIVGATVVTMGLLALPTMLRNGYSAELSTGVIAASGTLGQIIPPSIIIVLLGSLAGDIYSSAQETRAQLVGCTDALTYLGHPAVLSVGTLFKAAILPGVLIAALYAGYAFVFALIRPDRAPAVTSEVGASGPPIGRAMGLTWFLGVPAGLILAVSLAFMGGLAGGQGALDGGTTVTVVNQPELRTQVSDQCREAMIALHGQEKWDRSVAARAAQQGAGATVTTEAAAPVAVPAVSGSLLVSMLLAALALAAARGIDWRAPPLPLLVGAGGIALALALDAAVIRPEHTPGTAALILAVPFLLVLYGLRAAFGRLRKNELLRVVFPPLILIVAVLGSILGGITNPTPAAALGAAGAIMLAAYRRLHETGRSGQPILVASYAIVIMMVLGFSFDLRVTTSQVGFERWVAFLAATAAYHVAMIGLLFACWVLFRERILTPVVRETAKVTSMVFTILIGSQLLNLVIISFGGEVYIQQFLRSFDQEWVVFLLVMMVLFILGFVLDFLEIIYIVVPIVGPVIYGGTLDPAWVTIMIAVNLQTSFLTPPFGFALFYLRGVAPPEVTTGHIYRGIVPFVIIQVASLGILWLFPEIVTIVPALMGG